MIVRKPGQSARILQAGGDIEAQGPRGLSPTVQCPFLHVCHRQHRGGDTEARKSRPPQCAGSTTYGGPAHHSGGCVRPRENQAVPVPDPTLFPVPGAGTLQGHPLCRLDALLPGLGLPG